MIFLLRRRINTRTNKARRCGTKFSIFWISCLNKQIILIRRQSRLFSENYTGQKKSGFFLILFLLCLDGNRSISGKLKRPNSQTQFSLNWDLRDFRFDYYFSFGITSTSHFEGSGSQLPESSFYGIT